MDQLTKPEITNGDLIDALRDVLERRAEAGNGEGMTKREIQAAMGISATKTKELLISLHAAGMLAAARAYRSAIDGVNRPVPVYSLKKNAAP